MKSRLGKSLLVIAVCLFISPHPGHASLKSRIQSKLNVQKQEMNVQYEPYYLNTNYEVNGNDARLNAPVDAEEMAPQVVGNLREMEMKEDVSRFRQQGDCDAMQVAGSGGRMSRPRRELQPSNFIVYNVSYVSTLEDNVVTVKGEIIFEVFAHPQMRRAEVPLVSNQVGLIDVRVNRGKSFVMSRGNKYYLVIDKPGRYTLDIEYLLKAKRERENGPGSFHVDVMPAPISQFEFVLSGENVQVFIEPAIKVETESKDGKTEAWAVMPNTNAVDVRWTKALPKTTIEKVELDPKLYAETATFVSIGGGVVQAHSQIQYSILQAEVSTFRLVLPEDVSVLAVNSKEMRDWKVSKKDKVQYLDVFLNFGTKGKHVINVDFERNMDEGLSAVAMPWIRALDVERENGFYGIAASTNLEIKVARSDRVTPIDSKQLPRYIWQRAVSPILLAFKYLNHPFEIDIEMTRHEEIPVLVAAIDSAQPETLLTKDGKALTKLTYNVRNNVKQYLRIKLPETATVWSSFVNGQPVKPAKDAKGHVLISLKKSERGGGNVTQFPVEIVYLDKAKPIKGAGGLKLNLPKVDLPVNELYWQVYLPDDFVYFGAKSDGEIAEHRGRRRRHRGQFMARSAKRVGQAREAVMMDQVMTQQVAKDKAWGGKGKGLLPIKIDLPKRGDSYGISKMLVVEGDQPWLSVNYVPWGRTAQGSVKFLKFGLLFLVALWLVYRVFVKRKKKKAESV